MHFLKFYRHLDNSKLDTPTQFVALTTQVPFSNNWDMDMTLGIQKRQSTRFGGEIKLNYKDCCLETSIALHKDITNDDMSQPVNALGASLKFRLIGFN